MKPAIEMDRAQFEIKKMLDRRKREAQGLGERSSLRYLKPIHGQILALHCSGMRPREIADSLGIKVAGVYTTINSPIAKPIIEAYYRDMDEEFRGLYRRAIDVIAEAMQHEDTALRLQAVEKWLKAHGKYKIPDDGGGRRVSAEDVVAQLLEAHRTSGGSVKMSLEVTGTRAPEIEPLMIEHHEEKEDLL